jgi:hypothetical protein
MPDQSDQSAERRQRAEQVRNELGQVVEPPVRGDCLTLQTLKDHMIFVNMPEGARAALHDSCNTTANVFTPDEVVTANRETAQENYRFWKRLSQASAAVYAAQDTGNPALLGVRHFVTQRWGSFDLNGLSRVVDWLVAEHGLTVEQAHSLPLTDLVLEQV